MCNVIICPFEHYYPSAGRDFKSSLCWITKGIFTCKELLPKFIIGTSFSEISSWMYSKIPEIAITLPTSVVEKPNPPYLLSLTAQRENICKAFLN